MTLEGFVQTIRVQDLKPGSPPLDITETVQLVRKDAIPRILVRIEVHKPDRVDPAPMPQFFSIARRCTHASCNILKGGANWKRVDRPIVYAMLDAGRVDYAVIECPCHGSRFDLTTGERLLGPAILSLPRFDVKIEPVDGEPHVFVAIDPVQSAEPKIEV